MDYVPILFISCKTGQRVDQVLPMACAGAGGASCTSHHIHAQWRSFIVQQDAHPHPTMRARTKMYYVLSPPQTRRHS